MSKAYEPTIMEGAKQKYAFSVEKINQISDGSKKIIKVILEKACVFLVIVTVTMLVTSLKHLHSDKSDEAASECSRWINNPNISPSPQSNDQCSFDDIPNCTCDDREVPSSQCCEEVEKHETCQGEWSQSNAYNLIRMLRCFYLMSGLKINVHKSKLLGLCVSDDDILDMASVLGCGVSKLPLTYLGVPVGCNMGRSEN
ncbi:reverse transcriptase domain, Zinc finger, CCHC-type [Artemisia annua]|uniref:Reverse transcriptase domain, Zinc finger, CCHC-type n=1 Tax=Artemisia annua TaxID=35608 RepID=A0A2U1KYR0_ARTAN|nr:reverse transcriptase domain, Zinc finger, CCHC-type [Artemisia annua]